MTNNLQAIILAAGRSSRFNTKNTKLSYKICGQEMIAYPAKLLGQMKIPTTLIVGYQKEIVKETIEKHNLEASFVEQTDQKGTGHALLLTKDLWSKENILVMNGDMPLITKEILENLIEHHSKTKATITLVSAYNTDPSLQSYGRVLKENNKVEIIEAKHFKGDLNAPCFINAGIYLIKKEFLEKHIKDLQYNSLTGEMYITDLIALASQKNYLVETINAQFDLVRGVNTLKELWAAEQIKKSELINFWQERGVYFSLAQSVHIDLDVTIGSETLIGMGAQLLQGTRIGSRVNIGFGSVITSSEIHDDVIIHPCSVITKTKIESHAQIGPFAHIRNNSHIGESSVIGNFVEISKTEFGANSKAKHLTYIGNAKIGSNVNIGGGTIVCNYNGVTKNTTTIHDNASIGSNNCLVAPVEIGQEAITGAGSVITENVPDHALAVARAQQVNKENYALKLKEKYKKNDKIYSHG
ncbi:bifunctional UDP-N-acetylglucosamine diphosphorylase/glucosamine-1-phosphate N-acetyltransferase GlmU [Candidatus Dependentiae bacterium]|nr:bifunctional UDP-N-acetylglucosamine diphosphorylase/glucosamine-1-phosphate N-acetyltransferase GlmU [Candidatus Dependentiae bacterium]